MLRRGQLVFQKDVVRGFSAFSETNHLCFQCSRDKKEKPWNSTRAQVSSGKLCFTATFIFGKFTEHELMKDKKDHQLYCPLVVTSAGVSFLRQQCCRLHAPRLWPLQPVLHLNSFLRPRWCSKAFSFLHGHIAWIRILLSLQWHINTTIWSLQECFLCSWISCRETRHRHSTLPTSPPHPGTR